MVGLADGESFVSDPEIEREEGCVSEARIRTDADRSKEVVAVPVLAESVWVESVSVGLESSLVFVGEWAWVSEAPAVRVKDPDLVRGNGVGGTPPTASNVRFDNDPVSVLNVFWRLASEDCCISASSSLSV
jgi:hypothetical protein